MPPALPPQPGRAPVLVPDAPPPRQVVVGGVPVTVTVLPATEPADGPATAVQPMLPLSDEPTALRPALDADRARSWVAMLARAVAEVLDHRRPVGQLRTVLDDESLAMVAAWARLDVLRHCGVGPVQVMVVSPTRIEGSFTLRTGGRHLAVAVALERDAQRWRCSMLRILAPDALVVGRAA